MKAKLNKAISKAIIIGIALVLLLLLTSCDYTRKGTLYVYIAGKEKDVSLTKADITLSQVSMLLDANKTKNATAEDTWIILADETVTFDFIPLLNNSALLGGAKVPAGHYSQVKLVIDKSIINSSGREEDITPNGKVLYMPASFNVASTGTTNITLTLDVGK
jgi:hypothetical protein